MKIPKKVQNRKNTKKITKSKNTKKITKSKNTKNTSEAIIGGNGENDDKSEERSKGWGEVKNGGGEDQR